MAILGAAWFSVLPTPRYHYNRNCEGRVSFCGHGTGRPDWSHLLPPLLGRAAPGETSCAKKRARCRGGGTPWGRPSNPRSQEAFDSCLREWLNPLYFWTAAFEREGLKLMAALPVSWGMWLEGR